MVRCNLVHKVIIKLYLSTAAATPTYLSYVQTVPTQQLPTLLAQQCQELLHPFARSEKFNQFQTLHNNPPTTCNRLCKQMQHVTSNNVASLCTGLYKHLPYTAVADLGKGPPGAQLPPLPLFLN